VTVARLRSEDDFEGWRQTARALRAAEIAPERVKWVIGDGGDLLDQPPPASGTGPRFSVPRRFVDLAETVFLHRSERRMGLLYRLLWRLQSEPHLLEILSDSDVAEALRFKKEVDHAAYRMKQYVRFRKVVDDSGDDAWAAWVEPDHRVVERAAPFFVHRFANMRWAILTPDDCAYWNGEALSFGPGVAREAAPADDALEDLWRAYFSSIFNPARLKVKAMTAQMPRHLWRNLPEAAVIPSLIRQASERTHLMAQAPHTEPSRRTAKAIARKVRDGSYGEAYEPTSTKDVWPAVDGCRRCDLWRNATQGVAGEGPAHARLMLVGEQPGDQEDLAGKPFVGPAGQLLDRALAEASVPRAEAYVTNAVKHFKFEPRGKRRIHAKPNAGEITACKWWLDSERRLVRPKVIVALGATAGRAVFGRPVSVMKDRGQPVTLEDGATGLLTMHPSYMLRLPDEAEKARAFGLFVQDLRAAMSVT
jgi:probable DNA metabolism protein